MTVDALIRIDPVPEAEPARASGAAGARWWDRLFTGIVVTVPLVALVVAVGYFWHHGVGWFDLGLAVVLYVVTGLGISLGFHRLFTHRSFRA